MSNDPRTLPGDSVLPPMESAKPKTTSTPKAKTSGNTRNRFAVLNAFADFGARLVSTKAQACWWIIYRETKPDGLAQIAHRRIAECIGTSRHTVLRALAELKKAGLLIVVQRGHFGGTPSTYRLRAVPPNRSAHATGGCGRTWVPQVAPALPIP